MTIQALEAAHVDVAGVATALIDVGPAARMAGWDVSRKSFSYP